MCGVRESETEETANEDFSKDTTNMIFPHHGFVIMQNYGFWNDAYTRNLEIKGRLLLQPSIKHSLLSLGKKNRKKA